MHASFVLRALINLNRLEDELRALGPRSTRKDGLLARLADERTKIPPFILAHHDRVRARGRTSTVPVKHWVCRSCFISVPIGLRTKLLSRDDICVCENCGAYIYLPTEQEQAEWDAHQARKGEAAIKAAAPAPAAPSATGSKSKSAPNPAAKKRAKNGAQKKSPQSSSAHSSQSSKSTAGKNKKQKAPAARRKKH